MSEQPHPSQETLPPSRGLVHRDLKPANIMIEFSLPQVGGMAGAESAASPRATPSGVGRPVVMDFGLALRCEAEITLTLDGHIVGTPAYMSPEQAAGKGHQADRRSDVYSLGVILYELLCGELPFRGSKQMIVHQVLHEEPRRPRRLNDKVPRDLETICLKALEKDPSRRYDTAREMTDDLRRWVRGDPIRARPVGTLGRLVKWAKRCPALATLSFLTLLAAILTGIVATYAMTWRREAQTYSKGLQTYFQELQGELPGAVAPTGQTVQAVWKPFALAFSPKGQWLAASREDRMVKVWSTPSGEVVATLRKHARAVTCVAFSADGKTLASGSRDKSVKLWELATGKEFRSLVGHSMAVRFTSVACSGR